MTPFVVLGQMLEARLEGAARSWYQASSKEIANGATNERFQALVSIASRHARPTTALAPTGDELEAASSTLEGWNPERWTLQEALRVALILSRTDLDDESGELAVKRLFEFADEGELRAVYRSLALLPRPERFLDQACEGCRTNVTTVFESVVLDTPYPVRWFDDVAWHQAVVKSLFIAVPLWRMWGLDTRLSDELARMALDLVEERRSAHRAVQPELWLCLGTHGGERALAAMEAELGPSNSNTLGRCAAAYGLARAGHSARLADLVADESDPEVRAAMEDALAGNTQSTVFRALRPEQG